MPIIDHDDLARHVDSILANSTARGLIEAYVGIQTDAPSSLTDLATRDGRSRQAIHARILRHLHTIGQLDLKAGRLLHNTSHSILAHMETAAIGSASQPPNRLHDQTIRDLVAIGAVPPSAIPYIRLAVMIAPLDTRRLGDPIRHADQRLRQVMLPATRPMTEAEIRSRLRFYRVTNRAIESWPHLSLTDYILRSCGVEPNADGLYQPGSRWAHHFAPGPACAAWAVLSLRQSGHAMSMSQLSKAVLRTSAGHIPTQHDVIRSIRRHFTQQPELIRSNGLIRLREWSPYRFTSHGLTRTVSQEIVRTLARYGALPLPTLAATVAAATNRDAKYARHRIRHTKPTDPWRVLNNQRVVLDSPAISCSHAAAG